MQKLINCELINKTEYRLLFDKLSINLKHKLDVLRNNFRSNISCLFFIDSNGTSRVEIKSKIIEFDKKIQEGENYIKRMLNEKWEDLESSINKILQFLTSTIEYDIKNKMNEPGHNL